MKNMEEKSVPSIRIRQGHCGCFCCRMPCLQRFCHINVFMVVFCAIFILSLSVAGYLAGVVSTLEKRFQLKSAQVGAITTVSSSVSLALVVFVAYYGQTRHRPRIIAFGAVLVGIGTLLMSFPQFVYDTPEFLIRNRTEDSERTALCLVNAEVKQQNSMNLSSGSDDACAGIEDVTSSSSYGVGWLVLGQVLIGIGGSVFMPLSITFIDDNVPKTSTAFYVGVLFGASGIAPIIGFGFSSICLSYYNDYYKMSTIPITSDDPDWLGAWWLGFLIYGIATLVLSVPMFMFPKRISEQLESEEDVNENETFETVENGVEDIKDMFDMTVYRPTSFQTASDDDETCGAIKGFLKALYRICTNPAYLIIVSGVCLAFASLSGFFTFGAKFVETQFGVSTANSPLFLAGMVAPGGIFGNFLGGYIVKQLKLNTMGYARMIVIIAIPMTCVTPIIFFLGCDNPKIAGLTSDYHSEYAPNVNITHLDSPNLTPPSSSCNSFCQCESLYSPVCGSDDITYTSPCYAGCNEASMDENNKTTYQSCGCVSYSNLTEPSKEYSATKGECSRDCHTLWLFTGVFALIFFFNCIWSNPSFMLYLRIVDPRDRSIAVGFASLAIKALGFIPAPIFYGQAIQSTCIWSRQLSCEETGECLVHDIWQFRFNFLGLTYGLQVLVTILMIIGYFAVKRQTRKTEQGVSAYTNVNTTNN